MINWNNFENNLDIYISEKKARSIEDFTKYISDQYDILIKTGKNIYGHRVISSNKNILYNNLLNAFNIAKNKNTNNIGNYIFNAFWFYWQSVVMSNDIPPPGAINILSNKITFFGSRFNINFINSNNSKFFVKNLINNLKIHIKTISGVVIALVPIGTILTPTTFNWNGIN